MPKFEITSPEGKRFEITAPEGATQDDVLAYAKTQFSGQPAAATSDMPEKGYVDRRIDAVKNAASQAINPDFWKGVGRDLANFPPITPETKKQIQGVAEEAAFSALPITRVPKLERSVIVEPIKKVASALGRGIRDTTDLILPGGEKRIAERYIDKIVGENGRQSVIDALSQVTEKVKGSQPTAAQVVSHLPAGSPIVAHQKIVSETPGGISAKFGQRKLDQAAAVDAAKADRNAMTAPMREAALAKANEVGGVDAVSIFKQITALQSQPGLRASDLVKKTLDTIKEKISSLTNDAGKINADDLYTVRKEIGNVIAAHSKETANFDKKLSAGLRRDIQVGIDDAIEAAGGTGWKDYLAIYANKSKAIADELLRQKMEYKPIQRTALQGGINVAEESSARLPNLLSRPAMLLNYVRRGLGAGIEPKVDAILAERYLNPAEMAKRMRRVVPNERNATIEAIRQRTRRNNLVGRGAVAATAQGED